MRWAAFLAVVFTGCQVGNSGVFVPEYGSVGEGPTALITGTLVVDDGCIWIEAHEDRWLALWPTTLRVQIGDPITVRGNGREIATGDEVTFGGGEFWDPDHHEFVEGLIGQPIPERCDGRYWLVTGLIEDPP